MKKSLSIIIGTLLLMSLFFGIVGCTSQAPETSEEPDMVATQEPETTEESQEPEINNLPRPEPKEQ